MPLLVLELSERSELIEVNRINSPSCQSVTCNDLTQGYSLALTPPMAPTSPIRSDRLRLSTMSVRSDLGVLVARHYLVPLPAVGVSPQARSRYYSTCLALS